MLALGLTIFALFFAIGMPIWIVMLTTGIFLSVFYCNLPLINIALTMFGSVDTFTLMAVPFFLLSGNIMANCGPSKYIYDVINKYIGRLPGGLAMTSVGMCMIYAAITGSSAATLAGVARIAVPPMLEAGYSKKFCAGLLSVSATLGQLIPPSIYMITYGVLAQQNAGTLFLAGFIPGILIGLTFCGYAFLWSIKNKHLLTSSNQHYTAKEKFDSLVKGAPALIMPVVVLAGIYTGAFTPTEAAGVSVVYSLFISGAIYRNLTWKSFRTSFVDSINSFGMIFMLVASAIVFSQPLTFAQMPQKIALLITELGLSANGVIFLTVGLWFIMGMFLDPLPILYLTLPIMLPSLIALDVNLIHFNIITVVAMQIANVSPPFGVNLYVASSMIGVPVNDVVKEMLPLIAMLVIWLFILVFIPEISLFLPNLMR